VPIVELTNCYLRAVIANLTIYIWAYVGITVLDPFIFYMISFLYIKSIKIHGHAYALTTFEASEATELNNSLRFCTSVTWQFSLCQP